MCFQHWEVGPGGLSATVIASPGTVLKKSEIESAYLPPSELKQVVKGAKCILGADEMSAVHGYYMCSVAAA